MNVWDNYSGLEVIKGIASGEIPAPSIAETMAMSFTYAESGYVKFHATADERHLNPMGGVHGGFSATVLDSVTGCAVHTMLDAGVGFGTIDLQVKMVRPVPLDEEVIAEGKILNISRNLGVSEGSIKTKAGKLLAHATCTCMIIHKQS